MLNALDCELPVPSVLLVMVSILYNIFALLAMCRVFSAHSMVYASSLRCVNKIHCIMETKCRLFYYDYCCRWWVLVCFFRLRHSIAIVLSVAGLMLKRGQSHSAARIEINKNIMDDSVFIVRARCYQHFLCSLLLFCLFVSTPRQCICHWDSSHTVRMSRTSASCIFLLPFFPLFGYLFLFIFITALM